MKKISLSHICRDYLQLCYLFLDPRGSCSHFRFTVGLCSRVSCFLANTLLEPWKFYYLDIFSDHKGRCCPFIHLGTAISVFQYIRQQLCTFWPVEETKFFSIHHNATSCADAYIKPQSILKLRQNPYINLNHKQDAQKWDDVFFFLQKSKVQVKKYVIYENELRIYFLISFQKRLIFKVGAGVCELLYREDFSNI